MDFSFGIRPARRFAIKRSCSLERTPPTLIVEMIFPLARSSREIVTSRLISIPGQGANKTLLAGLAHPTTPLVATFKCRQTRKMSQDVSGQSDINKMKVEPDGSFKRAPSSFRNFVRKGAQFSPEKGAPSKPRFPTQILSPPPVADRYHLYVSYACRE